MKVHLRFNGKNIEVTVEANGSTVTEDVTNLFGAVDEDLIQDLEDAVQVFKDHNESIRLKEKD